jgi:hypothetical protein
MLQLALNFFSEWSEFWIERKTEKRQREHMFCDRHVGDAVCVSSPQSGEPKQAKILDRLVDVIHAPDMAK